MLDRTKKIVNPTSFKVLIIVSTALMQVPIIHFVFGGYIKYLLIFGFLVCFLQLMKLDVKSVFKDKASLFLVAFSFLYVVSIFLNRDSCLNANIKQLLYMLVFFFLFFIIDNHKDDINVVSYAVALITFVLSLLSFITYVLNIFEWYKTTKISEDQFIGVLSGPCLWGLYNANTCGSIAVISIIVSLYLLLSAKINNRLISVLVRILLVGNSMMQFIVLLLSKSRGAYYSFLVVVLLFAFLYLSKNMLYKRHNKVIRVVLSFFLSILMLVGIMFVSSIIQQESEKLIIVSSEEAKNPEYDTFFENSIEEILKKYAYDTSAFLGCYRANSLDAVSSSLGSAIGRENSGIADSSGRVTIWKSGIKVFLTSPIFGLTREGLVEPTCKVLEDIYGDNDSNSVLGGGLHNVYLTILCSSGLVGFMCFAISVCLVVFRAIKRIIVNETISIELLFSLVLCVYFFVSELVESRIMYTVSFFNVVFWIYFGCLNYYSLKENESSGEKM